MFLKANILKCFHNNSVMKLVNNLKRRIYPLLGCIGFFQNSTTNAFKYVSIEQNIANATLLKRGIDPMTSFIT